jgi:hypothetical protein
VFERRKVYLLWTEIQRIKEDKTIAVFSVTGAVQEGDSENLDVAH